MASCTQFERTPDIAADSQTRDASVSEADGVLMQTYLSCEERVLLAERRMRSPWTDEILCQLKRMCHSSVFGQSHEGKAAALLAYAVQKTLLHRESEVQEVLLGRAIWDEPEFDPNRDNKVRSAAEDLRARIAEYFEHEGRSDLIEIRLLPGSYVPQIGDRRATIIVETFVDWNPRADLEYLCGFLSDEIARQLNLVSGLRASRSDSRNNGGPLYLLRGSLASVQGVLWANHCLSDLKVGQVVSSYTHERDWNEAKHLAAEMAEAIVSVLQKRMTIELRTDVRTTAALAATGIGLPRRLTHDAYADN
jgi:TolB-like protein